VLSELQMHEYRACSLHETEWEFLSSLLLSVSRAN
jgi:hypothetical protein